jgi:hypothetical protein
MMITEDLKKKTADFYEFSEDEQDAIIDEILAMSKSSNKQEFISEIRKEFPQTEFSGINVIYDALSAQPEIWGDFFVEEYRRAFKEAEEVLNPYQILSVLDEMGFSERIDFPFAHDIINILGEYISHPNYVVQHRAIYLISDWLGEGNADKHQVLVATLNEFAQNHPNWKIRYLSYNTLWTNELLFKDTKRRLLDKFRAMLKNPLDIQ